MLDDKDIQKIVSLVATKEDVQEIKEELSGLKEIVQSLTVSVDKLVKIIADRETEYIMMSHQLSRHEKWFQQIADKLGLRLEH